MRERGREHYDAAIRCITARQEDAEICAKCTGLPTHFPLNWLSSTTSLLLRSLALKS